MQCQVDWTCLFTRELCCVAVACGMLRYFRRNNRLAAVVELRKSSWGTTPTRRRKRRNFDDVYYMGVHNR